MKSEAFYAEADDMQPGWGDTLRHIDELHDRVDRKGLITLKEALWIEWAEYRMSALRFDAVKKLAKERKLSRLTLEQSIWQGLLTALLEEVTA